MPRNASGTYTLPSGNPVVSGTLIEADWANTTLNDLANEMTDSLSRSGEGGMLAPFRLADGLQASPGIAWLNEPSTGFYREGSGEMWGVVGGAQILQYTSAGVLVPTGKTLTANGGITATTLTTSGLATLASASVTGNLSVGGTLTLTGGLTLNGNVTVGDSSADTLTINSTITSHLLFTDNTYDIGASGATRPRHLYLAGNGVIGGTLGVSGVLTASGGVTGNLTGNVTGNVTGNISGGTVAGSTGAFSSNVTVGGTLGVTNATTLSSTLGVTGATTLSSTLGVTGATTLSSTVDVTGALAASGGATINGGAVFNETGADVDFRIESDTDANAFFLDGANGNVGIGTSSPSNLLTVAGNANFTGNVTLGDATTDVTTVNGYAVTKSVPFNLNQDAPYLIAGTTSYTGAATNWGTYGFQHRLKSDAAGVPRITIDGTAGGVASELYSIDTANAVFNVNVGIGGTANATDKVTIAGTLPTSSNVSNGFVNRGTIPSGTTSSASIFRSGPTTEAASFTITTLNHFIASPQAFGAGSTVTGQYGFHAASPLTGATNNYGFYSAIASGSNRWNFYAAGTAKNYFAGNVGIGTLSPGARLSVQDTTFGTTALSVIGFDNGIKAVFGGETGTTSRGLRIATDINTASNAIAILDAQAATYGTLVFQTQSTERMRIDSSGNVGIGGTAEPYSKVMIGGTLPSSSASSVAFDAQATIPSGTTNGAAMFQSAPTTQAASFTMAGLYHFSASPAAFGAGSTVTTQIGFFANSNLTGATNNYGVYSNIASGSNRWNFFANGSADNYFAGDVGLGATDPQSKLHVDGGQYINSSSSLPALSTSIVSGEIHSGNSNNAATDSGYLRLSAGGGNTLGVKVALDLYRESGGGSGIIAYTAGTERLRLDGSGNVIVNTAAIATTATNGFLYVPSCAGTPTGTPTSYTGRVPIVVDTTNNKLYFYSNGTWRDAGP